MGFFPSFLMQQKIHPATEPLNVIKVGTQLPVWTEMTRKVVLLPNYLQRVDPLHQNKVSGRTLVKVRASELVNGTIKSRPSQAGKHFTSMQAGLGKGDKNFGCETLA